MNGAASSLNEPRNFRVRIVFLVVLLLHTSTRTIRSGLAEVDRVVARDEFAPQRDLAAVLADRVCILLKSKSHTLKALEKIVVHAGPGGFTSLRIGVTTANALAYALGVPIVGVTGAVADLDSLLERSTDLQAAIGRVVLPVYDRPPEIGTILHQLSPRVDT